MIIIKLYAYHIISVFIHELGRFVTLELFGVKVSGFSNKEFSELKLVPKLIIISSGALMNLLTCLLFPENKISNIGNIVYKSKHFNCCRMFSRKYAQ